MSQGNNKIRDREREVKPVTLVSSEKEEIRKCFMLISMEISLIYQKLLSSALICASACPLAAVSGVVLPVTPY